MCALCLCTRHVVDTPLSWGYMYMWLLWGLRGCYGSMWYLQALCGCYVVYMAVMGLCGIYRLYVAVMWFTWLLWLYVAFTGYMWLLRGLRPAVSHKKIAMCGSYGMALCEGVTVALKSCLKLFISMYRAKCKMNTVRAEIFAVVLFSRISRVKPLRKFPL